MITYFTYEFKYWVLAKIYISHIKAQGLKCCHVWGPNQWCVTADEEEAALYYSHPELFFFFFNCTSMQKQL